jgi:hypothetical protein
MREYSGDRERHDRMDRPAKVVAETEQDVKLIIGEKQMNIQAETITINGTDYIRADQVQQNPVGTRAVIVVDRGWIFAGDVKRENGRIKLSRALYVWAKDSNTGLNSSSAAATIASTTPGSNSTLSAGTEGYNTGVTQTQTSGTGTITVATPFVGGSLGKGGGLDTTLRTLAQSNGTANNAVLTLTNNAAISSATAAATDYTDTITVVGAGLF